MIKLNFKKIFSRSFMGEEKNIKSDSVIVQDRIIAPEKDVFDTHANKKRVAFIIITMILMIFVQEAFFNHMRIFGVKPFFPVVLIYIFAFLSEFRTAMFFGVGTGLYIDIIYGRFLGFYGIVMMYAAVGASLLSLIPSRESGRQKGKIRFMSLCAPGFFVLYTIVESFLARLMLMYSNSTNVLYVDYSVHFLRRILPVAGYDFLVFIVLVWPMVALWKKLGKKKNF